MTDTSGRTSHSSPGGQWLGSAMPRYRTRTEYTGANFKHARYTVVGQRWQQARWATRSDNTALGDPVPGNNRLGERHVSNGRRNAIDQGGQHQPCCAQRPYKYTLPARNTALAVRQIGYSATTRCRGRDAPGMVRHEWSCGDFSTARQRDCKRIAAERQIRARRSRWRQS